MWWNLPWEWMGMQQPSHDQILRPWHDKWWSMMTPRWFFLSLEEPWCLRKIARLLQMIPEWCHDNSWRSLKIPWWITHDDSWWLSKPDDPQWLLIGLWWLPMTHEWSWRLYGHGYAPSHHHSHYKFQVWFVENKLGSFKWLSFVKNDDVRLLWLMYSTCVGYTANHHDARSCSWPECDININSVNCREYTNNISRGKWMIHLCMFWPHLQNCQTQHLLSELHGFAQIWIVIMQIWAFYHADYST